MDQHKNQGNQPEPQQTDVPGGTHIKDIQPALEPKVDERARSEKSGEGDRADTDEMRKLDKD